MVFEANPNRYTDDQLREHEILGVDVPNSVLPVYAAHYASGECHFFAAVDRVEAREIAREYGKRILNWHELVSVHALQ